MEMIIIILFFSISSAVCIQSFVNAHLLDKKTMELNHAVIIAQGFADTMRGSDGTIDTLLSYYPKAVKEGDSKLRQYYDSDFLPCSENDENAVYLSEAVLTTKSKISTIDIVVSKPSENTDIFSLKASGFFDTQTSDDEE